MADEQQEEIADDGSDYAFSAGDLVRLWVAVGVIFAVGVGVGFFLGMRMTSDEAPIAAAITAPCPEGWVCSQPGTLMIPLSPPSLCADCTSL